MKKYFILLTLLIITFHFVHAQTYVTIPDSYFRNFLKKKYPTCFNENDEMDITSSLIKNETVLYLGAQNVSDITGVEYFTSLQTLDIAFNGVEDIAMIPPTITSLNCSSNSLKSISMLPPNLTYLSCYGNLITSISDLPASLTYLDCNSNPLTNIETLPDAITKLYCFYTPLSTLPNLPVSLEYLDCSSCVLTSLPAISAKLTYLKCNYNKLTSLPALPADLAFLECQDNLLTTLPALPANLPYLYCQNNKLSGLPALPAKLNTLNCSFNELTILPTLPAGLTLLACYDNKLTSIPALPDDLGNIYCRNNQLTSLPKFPSKLMGIDCAGNFLKVISFVTVKGAPVPTYLQSITADNNCFDETPENPNPSMVVSFKVEPNRSDCDEHVATAIDKQKDITGTQIYPNPASDKINVAVSVPSTLFVYNSIGEIMLERTISATQEIEIDFLNAGIYYYTLGDRSGKLLVK